MDFEIVGEISAIEPIAVGRGIRDRRRLQRAYGKGRWRKLRGVGIAYSHRIPPGKLKCRSEKREKEMAGLLGGEQASGQTVKSAGHASPLLRPDPRNEKRL